jgi:transcriptional regulator with XRE-family HTH domain
MDYRARLKLRLELLMKKQKITNELLAKETGISMSSINRIRMGRSNPTVETLITICDFFNISLQDIIAPEDGEVTNNMYENNEPISVVNSVLENNISLIKWESISVDSTLYKKREDLLQLINNITSDMFGVFTPREYGPIPKNSLVIIDTARKLISGDLVLTKNIQTSGISIVEYLQDIDQDYVSSLVPPSDNQEKKYFPLENFQVIGVILEFRNKLKEY